MNSAEDFARVSWCSLRGLQYMNEQGLVDVLVRGCCKDPEKNSLRGPCVILR